MEVKPANQDLLWVQLEQISELLSILQEVSDLWHVLEPDGAGDRNTDDLPDDA